MANFNWTYTVANADQTDFENNFQKAVPIPQDENGNDLFTIDAWIKEWGRRAFQRAYEAGVAASAATTGNPNTSIIT